MLETRLKRAEAEARQLHKKRIDKLLGTLTPDQTLVLMVALERHLLEADEREPQADWSATKRENMRSNLDRGDALITQKEEEEPGFRARILAELHGIDGSLSYDEARDGRSKPRSFGR